MNFGYLLLLAGVAVPACSLPRSLPYLPCGGIPFSVQNSVLEKSEAIRNGTVGIDAGSFAATSAWTTEWGPWPRDAQQKVTINYCYGTSLDRGILLYMFEEGIRKWMTALGGPASSASGHGIVFKERLYSNGQPIFCLQEGAPNNGWNPVLPIDTVTITRTGRDEENSGTRFSGYPTRPETLQPWKMMVVLSTRRDVLYNVMHELGHVMGMQHEHQREDRSRYVNFKCNKLKDFQKFKEQVGQVAMQWLCTDFDTALAHKFSATQFIKGYTIRGDPINIETQDYDFRSIMHYSSDAGAAPGCSVQAPWDCPLSRFHGNQYDLSFINARDRPSVLDAVWVKATYAWASPPPSANGQTDTQYTPV